MLTRIGKLVIAGGVIGLLLVIFGIIIDHVPSILMKKTMPIVDRPSSKSFPAWSAPSLPIYMNFHFFNVTNVEEVMKGGKPNVEEVGPYVYREKREKADITFNSDNSEVSYKDKIWYHFEPSMSSGSEDDLITNYNLPFIGVVSALLEANRTGNAKAAGAVLLLNGKVRVKKIKLFDYNTVGELLWGHTSSFFDAVYRNKRFKDKIKTNQWGLFYGRNGTAGDHMTIATGINGLDEIAQVKKYKDNESLDYWYTDYANAINGTDGSMFHPGIDKNEKLYMFSPDLCRSIMAEFKGEEEIHGVKTYHYGPSKSVFAGPDENPDNVAFCWPEGKAEDCLGQGLLRVSKCKKEAPLVASSPHLLGADAEKASMVSGLKPDPSKHVTKLNIEPNTGLLLAAKKRIQYNVLVTKIDKQSIFKEIQAEPFILPLFWVEEGIEPTEELAGKLGKVPKLLAMCRNLMLAFVAIGAMLLLGCLLAAFVNNERLTAPGPKQVPTSEPTQYDDVKYVPK